VDHNDNMERMPYYCLFLDFKFVFFSIIIPLDSKEKR
jgi:hypothetical protein